MIASKFDATRNTNINFYLVKKASAISLRGKCLVFKTYIYENY